MSQTNEMSVFKLGDTVTYRIWDGEEGRGYGWFWNQKVAKVVSVYYKMDNGDLIEATKLVLVEPPESKSEPPKVQQNGPPG